MRIMRTPPTPPATAAVVPESVPVPAPRPLHARTLRLRGAVKDKETAIRESDDQIVPCPTEEDFLTDIINRAPRERRERRAGEYLHVSDLIGKCVRKIALCDRHGVPIRPDRLSSSDIFTFAQGDAIHDAVKAMATNSSPARVWGKWRCHCGHLFHDIPCLNSETDEHDICPQCDTPTNVYEEVAMRDPDTMIVGTPDLILYLSEFAAFHVTEIKSIAHDQWKELLRPKPDHVLQVLFYWYLMRALGYRLTDMVSVFYVTKGYIFGGAQKPYKEFMFRPEHELHRLDPYLADARALVASRSKGAVPTTGAALPSRVCSGEFTVQAKKCEVCKICFGVD